MFNGPGDSPPATTSTSPGPAPASSDRPGTRAELQSWIHTRLNLPRHAEAELNTVIEHVITRQERLWQASKDEAIKALLAGFAERMATLRHAIVERDTTVSNISHYFERLVSELTDKTRRDPKTKLMNLGRFMEQLESFLALDSGRGGVPWASSISPHSSGTTTRSAMRWGPDHRTCRDDSR